MKDRWIIFRLLTALELSHPFNVSGKQNVIATPLPAREAISGLPFWGLLPCGTRDFTHRDDRVRNAPGSLYFWSESGSGQRPPYIKKEPFIFGCHRPSIQLQRFWRPPTLAFLLPCPRGLPALSSPILTKISRGCMNRLGRA